MRIAIMRDDIRHTSLAWMMVTTLVICNCGQLVDTSGIFQVRVLSGIDFKSDPIFSNLNDRGNASTTINNTFDNMSGENCSFRIEACLSHHLLPLPTVIECTLGNRTHEKWHSGDIIDIPFSFKWPGALTASIKVISVCKADNNKTNQTLAHLVFSHDLLPSQIWTRIPRRTSSNSATTEDSSDFRLPPRTSRAKHPTRAPNTLDRQQHSVSAYSETSEVVEVAIQTQSVDGHKIKHKSQESSINSIIQNSQGTENIVTGEETSADQFLQIKRKKKRTKFSNEKDVIHRSKNPMYLEVIERHLDPTDAIRHGSRGNLSEDEEEMISDIIPDENSFISHKLGGLPVVFRVVCQQHYFGDGCSNFCRSKDDFIGHFLCSEKGEKVCLDGWTGTDCTTAVCDQQCPADRGTCTGPDVCTCNPGWYGYECERCRTARGCRHGSCRNKPGQCLCHRGWTGPLCDVESQYCVDNKPCHNNGKCVHDQAHNYTCQCTSGYTGTNCQVPVCHEDFCLHGGSCLTSEGTRYCLCPPSFKGPRCQHVHFTQSQKTTTATPQPDTETEIGLHPKGRTAPLSSDDSNGNENPEDTGCDDDMDIVCLNGGQCVVSSDGHSYGCLCEEPYEGEFCEIDPRDPCEDYFCMYKGKCQIQDGEPFCSCKPGYSGDYCEVKVKVKSINACSRRVCENGGTCVLHKRKHKCVCRKNFYGKRCENEVDNDTNQHREEVRVSVWTVRMSSTADSCAGSRLIMAPAIVLLSVIVFVFGHV